MTLPSSMRRALLIAPVLVFGLWTTTVEAQESGPKFKKEIVAVLDLNVTGAGSPLALAASIRLREELLNSGFFQLVDRQRLKQVLEEQALSQATCVGTSCTIQIGKITGARLMMTGDLIQLNENTWQISALMTDVETSEVIRARSVYFEGSSGALLDDGVAQLVDKLVPKGDPGQYGGVVNFLLQKSSDVVKGAATNLLGVEEDKTTGAVKLKADNQYRILASPLSYFRYGIRGKGNHHLQFVVGKGASLGVEREVEKSWALGGSMHFGALRKRDDDSGASSLVLGYYTAWSVYILDGVPNGHPWFYYGTGLYSYSLNYTDAGENLEARGFGPLLMVRLMYSFDSGALIGAGTESNYLGAFRSRGTSIDQYRAAGKDVGPNAWGLTAYGFIGYTF